MELCQPCRSRNIEKVATRQVVRRNGGFIYKCTSCFKLGVAILRPHKTPEEPVGKASHEEDMQMSDTSSKAINHESLIADYKAGMSNGQLADKYGCSAATVSYHLKREGLAGQARPRAAKNRAPRLAKTPDDGVFESSAKQTAGQPWDVVIQDMIARRDKLNAAIEALRSL